MTGPIQKHLPPGSDIDSVIEVLLVLNGERIKIEPSQIPECFSPVTGKWHMRGRICPNHPLNPTIDTFRPT